MAQQGQTMVFLMVRLDAQQGLVGGVLHREYQVVGRTLRKLLTAHGHIIVVGGLTVPACHGRQLEMVVRYIAQRGAGQQEPMMTGGFLFYSRGEVQEQFRYDTQLRIEMSRRQVVVEHVSTLFISLRTMTEIIFYPTRHLQHL